MTTIGEFNCIFCKETFDDKETLQIHFRKHGDPNYNQQRRFSDPKMSGDKSNEPAEMVSCDVCPEVFSTISKAITHKHKYHPDHDAKYFCPWCGKLFTMKHLYNKHMDTNHTDVDQSDYNIFHCNCCDVDFFAAPAMLCHNKFFHRQDTDLPSVGLSKKQKLINQEAIPIYYCPFCGEEYDNKVNLHKHMGDDHSDENHRPDEVLRCPLCDAIFYHLDAYEIHLMFHSNEDFYSDQNEKRDEITEYSLETVAPIAEKVENLDESSKDNEDTINAMGIDQFLQLAMDDSNDTAPKKSKKHKKHKKSKKSAITLDEFLNMNKDVFGEELDVHGVEEVPTTVVARRLKVNKKPPQKPKAAKIATTSGIQKLKKQGIIVKKKTISNTFNAQGNSEGLHQPLKFSQNLVSERLKHNIQNKVNPNFLSTSNEVLSKLLSQSNNQIKIIKKPVQTINSIPKVKEHSPDTENVNLPETSQKTDQHEVKSPEPEHNIGSEDIEDGELHLNKNTLTIVCKTQEDKQEIENEMVSTLTKLDPRENDEDSSHYKDLQTNERTEGISNCSTYQDTDGETGHTIKKVCMNNDNIVNLPKGISDGPQGSEESYNMFTKSDDGKANEDIHSNKVPGDNSSNNSLSAIKHLSHLITVKPVSNSKDTLVDEENEPVDTDSSNTKSLEVSSPVLNVSCVRDVPNTNKKHNIELPQKPLQVFKILNKDITIKSLTQPSPNTLKYSEDDEGSDDDIDTEIDSKMLIKNASDRTSPVITDSSSNQVQNINMLKNKKGHTQPILHSPKAINKIPVEQAKDQDNANLLKRLTNVTAKPINTNKEFNKEIMEDRNRSNIIPNATKVNAAKFISKEIDENVEIFNIDDSDSDNDKDTGKVQEHVDFNINESAKPGQPVDALKSLGKHITVRNMRQDTIKIKQEPIVDDYETKTFSEDYETKTFKSDYPATMDHKNSVINNFLKNLGKNITVKSRNESPCQSVASQDNNTQDSNIENSDDSDSDSYSGKVKITEIENDDVSENELDAEHYNEAKSDADNQNIFVQSPSDSCGDREGSVNEDILDEEQDMEEQIKVHTLAKSNDFPPGTSTINSLKGINKNITIKSVKENKSQSRSKETTENKISANKELRFKPFKQTRIEQENNSASLKDSNGVENITNATNQINTVNKEVTVKTFQTQTVIQEITTTITKTIRTVNQTVNQVQNQSSFKTTMPPHRFQVVRPSIQVGRNLQGVTVRQGAPSIGCKIRNSTPLARPVVRNSVRVSNQVMTVRPGVTVPRHSGPRMPIKQKQTTTSSHPIPERNLKISPHAITSSVIKRSNPEEPSGPFSCFKKPKDTLFAVPDLPKTGNNSDMSNMHFSSSSQCSMSNVSTTKVVKGTSVVTSTQRKSEVSATSQQLSRLSNVSGLKIVKTSPKLEQVQQRSEISSKRTTLDAIEKLQKQGLLVKKPRLDVNEDSNHSEPEDDFNVGCSFTEENDD